MTNVKSQTIAKDTWKNARFYDDYMGRWSRLVASRFVEWLGVQPGLDWLEVGCGTGALTQAILSGANPKSVKAIDPAEAYIEFARSRTPDNRVSFVKGVIEDINGETEQFDVMVSGLVLNFMPKPSDSLEMMKKAARNNGVIAAYVWDYAEGMQFLRYFWDTASELNPGCEQSHEGRRFAICDPQALTGLFSGAGLRNVSVEGIEIPTVFRNFDDYWQPFTWGQGPTGSYCSSMNENERQNLRENLRTRLPYKPDGSIPMTARAWAVRGNK